MISTAGSGRRVRRRVHGLVFIGASEHRKTNIMSVLDVENKSQAGVLDRLDGRFEGRLNGNAAWVAADLNEDRWIVPVEPAAMAELELVANALEDYDEPFDELNPDAFDWPATTELMVEVKNRLDNGIGFAIIDRLPVEQWSDPAIRGVAWLFNVLLAPPIMQKWKGHRVYDVRDTGAALTYGVRRSITNLSQEFHTDGSFLKGTPEYFSLVCVRQANTGGTSRLASLATVHNALHEDYPELLDRLYQPFWWDRQAEHGADGQLANWLPVYRRTERGIAVRYYDDYIRNGYRLMEEEIDPLGAEALKTMQQIVEAPERSIEFRLRPGQIVFAQNQMIAHGRTGFVDPAEKDRKRLLLRFWLRISGGIQLEADPAPVA